MKKIKEFDDFIFDNLLEKINEGELPFVLSIRLAELLKTIKHKISTKLLEDNNSQEVSSKITLIDYDETKEDMFTYATSPKIIDYVVSKTLTDNHNRNIPFFISKQSDYGTGMWLENRSAIKIGKFINKIYPDTYVNAGKVGEDISSFVEMIKAERTKTKGMGNFRIVEGEDVVKYYLADNYENFGNGSTLYGSCMNNPECQPFIGFYAKNNIKLLVLMSEKEEDKIVGRALLWELSEVDGVKSDRTFMDRIYTIKNTQTEKFKQFARDHNYYYKDNQDMYANTPTVDPKELNIKPKFRIFRVNNIKQYKAYPYMDTLKCFNTKYNFLTNDESEKFDFYLESTDGGYEQNGEDYVYSEFHDTVLNQDDMVWSEDLDKYISREEAVYSESMDEWVSEEYAEAHWTYSNLEDDWFDNDDIVFINNKDGYVSSDYAEDNYKHCDKDDNWYKNDDCVESYDWGCVPIKHVVYVITDDDLEPKDLDKMKDVADFLGSGVDARWKGDKTYFTVHDKIKDKHWNFDTSLIDSTIVKKMKKGVK